MATSSNSSIAEPIEQVEGEPKEGEEAQAAIYEPTLIDALQTQFGSTPWWVVSAVIHVLLFLLASLLAVATLEPVKDEITFVSPPPPKHVEQLNETAKRDLFTQRHAPMSKEAETPMVVREPVPDDHFETENEMDKRTARGQEDAISDIPLGGTGVNASIGVGGGGMAGCFGFRDGGGRKKATAWWGGTRGSENAVEAALAWLKRHQEADGHWEAMKWEGSAKTDPGVTGLALLAFLGAGYTEKEGQYQAVVSRATQWLISKQAADGLIGGKDYQGSEEGDVGYNHAIAGLALAEAFGMGKNSSVGAAAQKAVDYSVNVHQAKGSGWRYTAGMEADLSVTGWFVMQLKSAKIAGLRVPDSAFQGAVAFTDTVSDQYGKCRYKADWLSPNYTMTSVGMLVRLYTGSAPGDAKVSGGANYLLQKLPVWGEHGMGVNLYYWYYGTMTMFQVGGDPWKKWNSALRDMLCDNQRKGGPKDGTKEDVDGSWDPVCEWGTRGGRVYSTATGALCLEVYYRYLPLYRQ
jgi:hypothetical protein